VSARVLLGESGTEEALSILRRGEVVALPTETVYGLAGDAFQPLAAARIFEAKGRPLSDPLIVHLPEVGWLNRVASFESPEQQKQVEQLASAFWPGPFTLILKKNPDLPDLVTAGMDRVAVRVTAHPLFQEVLRRLDSPLAAPSANRFGRISPTSAEDVQSELGMSISLILDGGPCEHGMESTIVAVKENGLEILRPGPVTRDQLKEYGHLIESLGAVNIPGSYPGHYAPKKKLQIIKTDIIDFIPIPGNALLSFINPSPESVRHFSTLEVLSTSGNLREAAANFYAMLRRLDSSESDMIYAESLPEDGIGAAIMDRMRRAEYGSMNRSG